MCEKYVSIRDPHIEDLSYSDNTDVWHNVCKPQDEFIFSKFHDSILTSWYMYVLSVFDECVPPGIVRESLAVSSVKKICGITSC